VSGRISSMLNTSVLLTWPDANDTVFMRRRPIAVGGSEGVSRCLRTALAPLLLLSVRPSGPAWLLWRATSRTP
jgi:hypothetical protein